MSDRRVKGSAVSVVVPCRHHRRRTRHRRCRGPGVLGAGRISRRATARHRGETSAGDCSPGEPPSRSVGHAHAACGGRCAERYATPRCAAPRCPGRAECAHPAVVCAAGAVDCRDDAARAATTFTVRRVPEVAPVVSEPVPERVAARCNFLVALCLSHGDRGGLTVLCPSWRATLAEFGPWPRVRRI